MPSLLAPCPHCIVLSSTEVGFEPQIQRFWEHQLAESDPIGALYRSPEWFGHLNAAEPGLPLHLAVLGDAAGKVDGIASLAIRRIPLSFQAAGYSLADVHIRVVDMLGGQPLVADDPVVYDQLLAALGKTFPDCDGIRLTDIPVRGSLFRHLHESAGIRQVFSVCVFGGLPPFQTLPLPATFGEYLARFSSKKRYNLRRQERLLKEHGRGRLELRRWENPADVPGLLRQLALVAERANDRRICLREVTADRYSDLAGRGLLRCYTLVSGEGPVAALVGCQFGATYTVDMTLYDSELASLSPGTTMAHLAVADLISYRPVRLIAYGYGKPSHHQQPPRVPQNYAKVLLLRRTLRNRFLWASFCAFRASMCASRAPVRLLEGRFRRLFRCG